jgi:hypothetical protein
MYVKQMQALSSLRHLLNGLVSLRSLGYDAVAWSYPDVLVTVKDLAEAGCVILGADVISISSELLLSTTMDSMYYEPKPNRDNAALSCISATAYIANYIERNGNAFIFDLTVDSTHFLGDKQVHKRDALHRSCIAGEASIAMSVLRESPYSVDLEIGVEFYHISKQFVLPVTKLSVKDVAMKLKSYSNKYPSIDEYAIIDPFSAYPNLIFLLTPQDEYSGHVKLCVYSHENDCMCKHMTTLIVGLPQLEEFGSSLLKMLGSNFADRAFIIDELSYGLVLSC